MTRRKTSDKRDRSEEESSQIRTRKVQFTGGGFAFPTPEDETKPVPRRKTSGRDAIIVEGRPGQANIKKQDDSENNNDRTGKNSVNINIEGNSSDKTQKKNKKQNKSGHSSAAQPRENIKTANTAEPKNAENKPDSGRQQNEKKQSSGRKKSGAQKQTAARNLSEPVKEPVKPQTEAAPAKPTPAPAAKKDTTTGKNTQKKSAGQKKTAGKSNEASKAEIKKPETTTAGKTASAQDTMQQAPSLPTTEKTKNTEEMKHRNNKKSPRGEKKNRDSRRSQPRDHRSGRDTGAETVLECRFSYSGRGFGFAVPNEPENSLGEDIFIAPRASMGAMTGDLVQVKVFRRPGSGHSAEGEVTAVLERTADAVTGRLTIGDGWAAVKPDNEKLRVLIYVPVEDCEMIGAKDGDKVEVIPDGEPYFTRTRSITIQRRKRDKYDEVPFFDTKGRITTLFGPSAGREANYAAILHTSGIRTEFPPYVLQSAENSAAQPLSPAGRVDLRDKMIFTIDGADAKDLDDAISLEKTPEGDWLLGVHIADVSHYVPYESCVEKEARARGTSVYFVDKVVPMLPKSLSNGACSLNAGTDKYALSCEITLTPDGHRKHAAVYKSILRSTVRGVYSEVNDLFDAGEASPFREKYAAALPMLEEMRILYRILRDQAAGRGVMELEDAEAKILLNEEGFPVEIVRRERGDAEKMIEQFMLQANMGVAETLRAHGLPCLYRIHEEPDRDKLRAFAVYAHNLGLPTFGLTAESSGDKMTSGLSDKLMGILAEANKKEIGDIVSSVLLRSMMKAKYVEEPKPHFGLGAETYCHFTSPIRRYPDLFVHTVLTAVLPYAPNGRLTTGTVLPPEALPQMLAMAAPERGVSSTDTEINAQQAEWKIEDLYMALYMSDKIGQVFDVTVVSVMKFGLFVQCDNLVEGLIPAPLFEDAVVNEAFCTLRSGGTLYTLGTKMQARLVEADPANGRITFAPVEDEGRSMTV